MVGGADKVNGLCGVEDVRHFALRDEAWDVLLEERHERGLHRILPAALLLGVHDASCHAVGLHAHRQSRQQVCGAGKLTGNEMEGILAAL